MTLTRPINGSNYTISTTYDAMDRPLTISFPNGDVLTYVYGDHGRPIHLILNGSQYLVQGATYNALLKLKTLPLGNGIVTTNNYFGTGLDYQPPSPHQNLFFGLPFQLFTGPGYAIQNQQLWYDYVGNPQTHAFYDHTIETLTFSYNELDQLTQMTGPGSANEGYGSYIQSGSFDIGNLLAKGPATLVYGATQPHAPSSVSTVGSYGYDANGNRSTDPTYSYTYDAENHLTLLKQGSTTILQNAYDGDGARLVRIQSGTTTHYVGGSYEYDPNAHTATVYYPFNGIPVAMNKAGTLSYLHHDHLGSLASASNVSGTEIASARYWPFGGLRVTTGTLPTDRLFTGQVRDLGDDRFYFFKSRYYDATIGKFQTADTIVPGAGNPQALNRYAYGLNSPLRFADPSGHDAVDPNWVQRWMADPDHRGSMPGHQDWNDYQFSLNHSGSGSNGAWTSLDWQSMYYVRAALGPALLNEIGRPQDGGLAGQSIANEAAGLTGLKGVPWVSGPDGTRIYLGGNVPPTALAWTFGNNIIIGTKVLSQLATGEASLSDYRALIIHEYTHVLQYRRLKAGFLDEYVASGLANVAATGNWDNFGNRRNGLEDPAYAIQGTYAADPGLAAPWEFWP